MIRIAVVDDEKEFSDELKGFVLRYCKARHIPVEIEVFTDGIHFIDEYDSRFDLVFMDIAMPHMNGLEAARRLRQKDKSVCLIFITTLAKYAIKGYEVDALDFIVKSPSYELFEIKMDKALERIGKTGEATYTLSTPGEMRKIKISDVLYIEQIKHYLYFKMKDGEERIRGAVKDVSEFFLKEGFAFASRSLLVNLSHVKSFSGSEVVVETERLPIARPYKQSFLSELTAFVGGGAQ